MLASGYIPAGNAKTEFPCRQPVNCLADISGHRYIHLAVKPFDVGRTELRVIIEILPRKACTSDLPYIYRDDLSFQLRIEEVPVRLELPGVQEIDIVARGGASRHIAKNQGRAPHLV